MEFLSFFFLLKEDIFPKMHLFCLEVIIDIFKPDEFITLHGCSDKLTIRGIFVTTVIRPIFLKMPVEVILFSSSNI